MSEKETESYVTANLEGEHLTGGPSLKTLLLVLLAVVVVAGGVAAWFLEVGVSPQVKRERFVNQARASLSQGKLSEAIIALRNATDADPRSAETFHQLGIVYVYAGNQREAFQQFLRAVQLDPNLIQPRFQLARLYASRKGLVQAGEQLLKIRDLAPTAIEGIVLACEIALAQRNLDGALAILRDAIAGSPNNIAFHMNIGAVQIAKGDYSAAEASYTKARQLEPKSLVARTALATIFLNQGNRDKAEKELLDAIKLDPDNDELLQVLGNFYSRTQQFDHLEKLYRGLLAKWPDSMMAKKVLVELAFGKGDLKQAKEFTDSILNAYPDDIVGRLFRARQLIEARDYEKASRLLTTVTGDSPGHAPAHYFLGITMLGTGRMDEARTALTKATELRPSWITPRLDLAALYLVIGDDRLALQEAQKVLEKYPDHRSALYTAAGALYKKGDYNKTLELFQRIQKHHPKDSAIHMSLGGVYVAQFKFAQAQHEYEEALRLSPTRIKASSSTLVKDAYNTTVNNVIFNGSTDTFNHALLLSQEPTVNTGGTTHRDFVRDINKPKSANDKLLSVSDIQVFLTDISNQSSVSSIRHGTKNELILKNSAPLYQLDRPKGQNGDDDSIKPDYSLDSASGSSNMSMLLIPDWLFQNILKSNPTYTQLALYSKFGEPYPREDGYEEWFFCNSEKDGSGTPEACTPGTTHENTGETSSGQVPDHRRTR
jgi:tetratricopeptide (TPR) repeat protein